MADCLRPRLLLTLVLLVGLIRSSSAGQWPQILGPHRNGHAENEDLADDWPAGGPETVWQREVGRGFAGVAVAEGHAVLFHRREDKEVVEALDPQAGEPQWQTTFPTDYRPRIIRDDGPRCVPLIHEGRVYVFGVQGGLRCLELENGKTIWSRPTHEDFQAREGYFGAGSTPLIEGDKILVNVGGRRTGAGIVAFSLETGKTVWKATRKKPSYSSPVAATIDGVRHALFVTRLKAVSLDPKTGEVRFQFPFGARGPTVNAASPVVLKDHVFFSAAYGVGAVYAKITKDSAETIWENDKTLSSQYTTAIAEGGYLYGIHGRQDVGQASLRCVDPQNGEIQWSQPDFGYATLIEADGKLLILTTAGELVLAEPNAEEYQEIARAALFENTTRALPALADGFFYARDNETLRCIDLSSQR